MSLTPLVDGLTIPEVAKRCLAQVPKTVLEVLIQATGCHIPIDVNHWRVPEPQKWLSRFSAYL
jgi:hypothetical protein